MNQLRTDRELLRCIYEMYNASYPHDTGNPGIGPYVFIDVRAVADRLNCKPDIVFGRLYYHLDEEYRYLRDDGAHVNLFHMNLAEKGHAVHFPYLVAILAGLEQEHRRQFWALAFSVLALVVSIASLITNIAANLVDKY